MTTSWLWIPLLALLTVTLRAYCVQKIRLDNYRCGQVSRDWILCNAPAVLIDPNAPLTAQTAASVMLECIYAPALMHEIQTHNVTVDAVADGSQNVSSATEGTLYERAGHYRDFVSDGLKHLVTLTILDMTWTGFAFRYILTQKGDRPLEFVTRNLSGHRGFHKATADSLSNDAMTKAAAALPSGQKFFLVLESKLNGVAV